MRAVAISSDKVIIDYNDILYLCDLNYGTVNSVVSSVTQVFRFRPDLKEPDKHYVVPKAIETAVSAYKVSAQELAMLEETHELRVQERELVALAYKGD